MGGVGFGWCDLWVWVAAGLGFVRVTGGFATLVWFWWVRLVGWVFGFSFLWLAGIVLVLDGGCRLALLGVVAGVGFIWVSV